ncbi:UDP-N-acetylmuramate dehydrogenase [Flavicella sediminum]|uniref:UDP-N-acetylmuramate dehydrogenase n=1 Tax=Flavicella sediminum TaxID=2585141 RepID=UPI00112190D9|nr:UDP-N-acetylmuramate dehydrogenase [Flavicella sediminum]
MHIQSNISLKAFNTFGIDVLAKKYISVQTKEELVEVVSEEKELFVLSGGSNLLLTKDIESLVVHLNTKGIQTILISENEVLVKVAAGENWHDFVLWCVAQNFGGLENLSLIPGNVGTCPIQNIGAYGVEVKDTISEVEAIEIATGTTKIFSNEACEFGYRNSVFKNQLKGQYILTSISFKLTRNSHQLHASYGAIQEQLKENGIDSPSIKDISNAVIAIRNSKLPNPKEIGNSGSFFKNPVIPTTQFKKIQEIHTNMPFYKVSETEIKVPAGWLIEQCGFKGKRFGNTGSHTKQALVLVNYGNATGKEVYKLAKHIQNTVAQKFDVSLEIEVNVM